MPAKSTLTSWNGPTSCSGDEVGNYQHMNWACQNGVPMFSVTGFNTPSGGYESVPTAQRLPGASSPVTPGSTIVKDGTLWAFDIEQGYVNTGTKAEPLVVIDSSGNVTSPGYNPGTGGWQIDQNPDGSAVYGVAPDNAAKLAGAYDQLQAAVTSIGSLIGKS